MLFVTILILIGGADIESSCHCGVIFFRNITLCLFYFLLAMQALSQLDILKYFSRRIEIKKNLIGHNNGNKLGMSWAKLSSS